MKIRKYKIFQSNNLIYCLSYPVKGIKNLRFASQSYLQADEVILAILPSHHNTYRKTLLYFKHFPFYRF